MGINRDMDCCHRPRGGAGLGGAEAVKSHYRNMTPLKAELIRVLYFSRILKQVEIAELFGIRQSSVSRIVSGRVWA